MGYIIDDRNTNDYTLNTIAIYLGFNTWDELCGSLRIDSDWSYEDQTVYTEDLPVGSTITVKYLDRIVSFSVVYFLNRRMLQVTKATNSSLCIEDILAVDHLRVGQVLEAKTVYRGNVVGNYRTNGELNEIIVNGMQ